MFYIKGFFLLLSNQVFRLSISSQKVTFLLEVFVAGGTGPDTKCCFLPLLCKLCFDVNCLLMKDDLGSGIEQCVSPVTTKASKFVSQGFQLENSGLISCVDQVTCPFLDYFRRFSPINPRNHFVWLFAARLWEFFPVFFFSFFFKLKNFEP